MIRHNAQEYAQAAHTVIDVLAKYLKESQEACVPVLKQVNIEEIKSELNLDKLIAEGGLDVDNIGTFVQQFLDYSMHMHHPNYIGHQVGVPHPAAAIADTINGLISNPMSIYEMGPSAATIERVLVNWMLGKVGWNDTGAGLFTHGGSLANIHAMLAARAAQDPNAWSDGPKNDLVVLAPENSHYSISRAIAIIGLGQKALVPVPTDQHERLIPSALDKLIIEVKRQGKTIMAVVANACATSTGLHDPLEEVGAICKKHNCWFHVDSPHGATAMLSPKYQYLMKGLEAADSMVWDAHKMMQTSSLSTALLFKKASHYHQTFSQKASYLIHDKENPGYDVLPYQIECTKAGLATKLFFVLAAIGEQGMGQFIEEIYDRTREFAKLINDTEGFTCEVPVESNILCFQYLPQQFNQLSLREKLIKTGEFYITSTEIKGVRYLRLVLMHLGTTTNTIKSLLEKIIEVANNE